MERDAALRQLDAVANELDRLGKAGLAERTRDAASALRHDRNGHIDADAMLSPAEAAEIIGIRNVGMIDRWSREGRLEGCRVGGRLCVSRRSVERLRDGPIGAGYRAHEREMDYVLSEFDAGDLELDAPVTTHAGRRPWDAGDAGER